MPSRVIWQSLFLPQAAASFEHTLSTHLPQSVLPKEGGGGADAAVVSGLGAGAAGASAAADADAAGVEVSEPVGPAELAADELSADELWSAGLSGGLDPPPQANQASGKAAMRTRAVMGRRWSRLIVTACVARSGRDSKQQRHEHAPIAPRRARNENFCPGKSVLPWQSLAIGGRRSGQEWGRTSGWGPIGPPMPGGNPRCGGASPIFKSSTSKTSIPAGAPGLPL
jgi:hypothetical protein